MNDSPQKLQTFYRLRPGCLLMVPEEEPRVEAVTAASIKIGGIWVRRKGAACCYYETLREALEAASLNLAEEIGREQRVLERRQEMLEAYRKRLADVQAALAIGKGRYAPYRQMPSGADIEFED